MQRSGLSSDIIDETCEDVPTMGGSTTIKEETTPTFYSHRFILGIKAPYISLQPIISRTHPIYVNSQNSGYPLPLSLHQGNKWGEGRRFCQ